MIRICGQEVDVSAALDGVLALWLVHDGEWVPAGSSLARPYPEVSQ